MADTNAPGAPGTEQPGAPVTNPGTDGSPTTPEFLTKEEFGRSAAMIRGLGDTLKSIQGNLMTLDSLAQVGLLDIEEVDGKKQYKPKHIAPPSAQPAGPKPRAEDDPLFQRVKTLESQLDRARKEKDDSDRAIAETHRDTAIVEALREAGALNPQRDYMHLRQRVMKTDGGVYFAKSTDEAGYEVDVKLPELAKEFLKANPELKKAVSQGGSGTTNGNNGGGGGNNGLKPGQTLIPKSQWSDMSFFMNNRSKFADGTYVRGQ